MGELSGKVALVTGGSDGIGRAIVETFLREGAQVATTGRNAERGAKLLADIGAGDDLHFVASDATTSAGATAGVQGCLDRFGGIDVLVNNVGGAPSEFKVVHELSDEGWESGIAYNLHSAFWTTRAALPSMLERGGGRIVMMSSVEAKLVSFPAISPYAVGKHALAGLTKAIALEYGQQGITCNAVCPGPVRTETFDRNAVTSAAGAGLSVEEFLASFVEDSVTKAYSSVEQVAAVTLLLCSDAAANITGAHWSIDGGMSHA